jgi:hypothetical protein
MTWNSCKAFLSIGESLSIARRWLVREVGFNENGKAKPCLIIYDYLKTQSASELKKALQEFQVIGFMMADLHNFAARYGVPIQCLVQLNREGIDTEDTSTIGLSDRIGQICSNFTILKNKEKNDEVFGGPCKEAGNKKLVIVAARHGPGLDPEKDMFINLRASIQPGVSKVEATGKILEGDTAGGWQLHVGENSVDT